MRSRTPGRTGSGAVTLSDQYPSSIAMMSSGLTWATSVGFSEVAVLQQHGGRRTGIPALIGPAHTSRLFANVPGRRIVHSSVREVTACSIAR